ncbi:MAG TPA: hypothetical protein VMU04_20970 [Candidatus Acidoferrum sp.]|nr:hypothetical protein [Candidatus Acidoferrum sp.]
MEQNKICWGLLKRRQCVVPTLRAWALFVLVGGALVVVGVRQLGSFLTLTDPVQGGVLVVEGWVPDYGYEASIAEFKRVHYDKMFVTGLPLERGAPLSEYKTYAELGAAVLVKMGMSTNDVQAVPAALVLQDRTYAMARALRRWMLEHGMRPTKVQIMTIGPHARRSRLTFQKAFGKDVAVGITAIPSREFDPRHWWTSSEGVRGVIGEALAYLYARLLFHPAMGAGAGA